MPNCQLKNNRYVVVLILFPHHHGQRNLERCSSCSDQYVTVRFWEMSLFHKWLDPHQKVDKPVKLIMEYLIMPARTKNTVPLLT